MSSDVRQLRELGVPPADSTPTFLRPSRSFGLLFDGVFAVVAYPAAVWLRFDRDTVATFLPAAFATLPWIVVAQLGALISWRAYAPMPRTDWLRRVVIAVVSGTCVAGAVLAVSTRLEGVSRIALSADAVLLSIAAVGWRGAWVLRARARAAAQARYERNYLVDRAEEMSTIGSVVRSLYQYRELLKNLVLKDLKLKYRGSVFGFLWSLLNPLLMIAVYTVAFTVILGIRGKGFVLYLMLGQLAWSFFGASAAMATGTIIDSSGLIKSVLFPKAILPIATVLFNLAQYILTLLVFLPLMLLWFRVPLSPQMLVFPVFLALQVIFIVGVAFMLATATAFFRDVRHLLEVTLTMLFWTTPIVYELRLVPESLKLPIMLSPMSPFVMAYQSVFYFRQWPDVSVWLIAIFYAAASLIVGAMVFFTFEDRLTEQL